jgi:putative phosphoesterase
MKIAVLSDTHIPYAAPELPAHVLEVVKTADAIIHAGDFQVDSVIDTLLSYADFYGVCGNMDTGGMQNRLPTRRIIKLGDFSIGVMHGWGSPSGLEERLLAAFKDDPIDVLVYGHSHRVKNEMRDGILLFNPGSPTDTRFAAFQSMGILTIEETIRGEILYF